ncbi:hypothetical protein [Xanthobacter sp. 91]|uniref:hypothetical protein n=1 Tax=Xanthobacter sp. 91 TaxID=1117244 RepID=UPI0004959EA6|nr:hypothetical protein [Xanthobacter sp. 91]
MMLRILILFAAALPLAGCFATAPAPKPRITLTEVPEDIRACARKVVGKPKGAGPIPKRDLFLKIDELKGSEADKSACLFRLIALHEADAARLALILDGAL